MKKTLIILAVVFGILFAGGVGIYGYFNGLKTELVDRETSLSASYQSNQLELDTYVKQIKEGAGIANLKSDKLDQILRNAVSGRYGDGKGDIKNGQGGAFMSAIVEAYPNLQGQLDVYDRLVDKVFAGREAFKQKQNLLLDKIRSFEKWTNTGLVQSFMIQNIMGAPTYLLEARIGTNVKHGREALDQMKLVVTSASTSQAFTTGQDEAIDLSGKKPE